MEYSEYVETKKEVENYFAKIFKSRFKTYVDENYESLVPTVEVCK